MDSFQCLANLLLNFNTEDTILYYTPVHYRIDNLEENGYGIYNGDVLEMPEPLSLTYMHYTSSKIILLYTPFHIYIWIGRQVSPEKFYSIFETELDTISNISLYNVLCSSYEKPILNILNYLQNGRTYLPPFVIVREGSIDEKEYKKILIEDSNNEDISYFHYINQIMLLTK